MKQIRCTCAIALLTATASAQSFNIDVGLQQTFPEPSMTYGAGAGQPGFWNGISGTTAGDPLLDLSGAATGVMINQVGGVQNFIFDNPNTTGDDELLMDDAQDIAGPGTLCTWTISGLENRNYDVFTYSWAPDDPVNFNSSVTVPGSPDPEQILMGNWPGMHQQGVTFAKHRILVTNNTLDIEVRSVAGFGTTNAIQIVETSCGTGIASYCTAKSGLVCGTPAIDFSGTPSASATSGFEVSAGPARGNRSGVLLYTDAGAAAIPFQGGFLCINPAPLRRTVPVNSGGTPGGCDGTFLLDMNCFASGSCGGNPDQFLTMPGTDVNVQWWGRDSVATGSFLSDGLTWEVCP